MQVGCDARNRSRRTGRFATSSTSESIRPRRISMGAHANSSERVENDDLKAATDLIAGIDVNRGSRSRRSMDSFRPATFLGKMPATRSRSTRRRKGIKLAMRELSGHASLRHRSGSVPCSSMEIADTLAHSLACRDVFLGQDFPSC